MTDSELLSKYQATQAPEIFAQIVERHAGSVYAACLRVLNDTHAAEDASQAVFMVFVQKSPGLSPSTVLAGWFYQTAVGVAQNARRMQIRRERHQREAAALKTFTDSDAQSSAAWDEIRPHIDGALAKLPAAQRDAIVLCFLQGRARDAAALELKCPLKTLNSRINLALEKLRTELSRIGISVPCAAIAGQLGTQATVALPSGLSASIAGACLSKTATVGASIMMEGFMKALFWAKIKACVLGIAAVLFLGTMAPSVYRALAAKPANNAAIAPVAPIDTRGEKTAEPKAAPKAFVPKGGKIIAQVKLPAPLANKGYGTVLEWNFDHTKLLFPTIDRTALKRNGERDSYRDYEIYTCDFASGTTTKLFSYAGISDSVHWVAGDRILACSDKGVILVDSKGARTDIVIADAANYSTPHRAMISPSGKHFIIHAFVAGTNSQIYAVLFGSVDSATAKVLVPPTTNPDRTLKLSCGGNWTPEGTIRVTSDWTTGQRFGGGVDERSWLFDPATGKFEPQASPVGAVELGSHLVDRVFTKPESDLVIWKMPQGTLRRVLAPAKDNPNGPPGFDQPGRAPADRITGTASALELLDHQGKVVKRIDIDAQTAGGADLWPRVASPDGHYLLISTFRKFKYEFGAPWGGWVPQRERDLMLDLQEGKFVAGFNTSNLRPARIEAHAVMAPTRQFLLLDTEATDYTAKGPNTNHGIWSIPFDGKPQNLAPDLGLPPTWEGRITYGGFDSQRSRMADRIALVARPQAYLKGAGPRQLLVFFNSAQPIRAYMSAGVEDEPDNVTWSRNGEMIAFSTANILNVWKATEEPGEPGPKKTKDADF